MILSSWILFVLAIQIIHFLGTWRLYKAAGYKGWYAAIPIYNAFILMKIIKRPSWWVLLLFIPTVNLIVFGAIWIETLRSFGKNTIKDKRDNFFVFSRFLEACRPEPMGRTRVRAAGARRKKNAQK